MLVAIRILSVELSHAHGAGGRLKPLPRAIGKKSPRLGALLGRPWPGAARRQCLMPEREAANAVFMLPGPPQGIRFFSESIKIRVSRGVRFPHPSLG